MREMAARVTDLLVETIEGLDDRPASDTSGAERAAKRVSGPPPENPRESLDALLRKVREAAEPTFETAGPSYLAYIPGGGLFAAALADYLALGLNRYTGVAALAPACVALEQSVLRWMCDLFSMPESAQGLLMSGGSLANLTALVAARTRHADGAVDRATVYVGEHAHASVAKAARTAGIAAAHVRTVESTPDLGMDPEDLRRCIERDRGRGLVPVCITAAAGTTNTGTVDPLAEIAKVARGAGVWFHVDAAYGGFFQLTERGRARLTGIERADSITLDPHKSLFLPFGTGALVMRRREDLLRSFSGRADYLQDLGPSASLPDFNDLGPELTREFRGLRLWLPLHLHGVEAFRRQLDEKLDLAALAHETLAADRRFELPWAPDLSVVTFRLAGADDGAQLRLLERINDTQRVRLSSTRIAGQTFLRIAVLSLRTHEGRIRECLEIVARAADEVS